jgi:hypothetical protein
LVPIFASLARSIVQASTLPDGLRGKLARVVVLPYVVHRLFLGCIGVFAMEFIPSKRSFHALPHLIGLDAWIRWDSEYYILIAERGYGVHRAANPNAFFPLYPALSALVGSVVRMPIAAWLVANVAAIVALCLLYVLVRDTDDESLARRSVMIAILFPTSYFLSCVYAESTYLALALGAVLAAAKGRQMVALALVFLACLARPQGFLCLTIPFLVGWVLRRKEGASLPWFTVAAGPAAAVLMLIHRAYTGDPLGFLHSATVQSLGVFEGPRTDPQSLWGVFLDEGLGQNLMRRLLNWSALALVFLASVHLFRRKQWEMASLSLFALGIPLFFHATLFDAASMARYTLLAFPVFIVLARWTREGQRAWVLDTAFVMLQTMLFALFACWYWVE